MKRRVHRGDGRECYGQVEDGDKANRQTDSQSDRQRGRRGKEVGVTGESDDGDGGS